MKWPFWSSAKSSSPPDDGVATTNKDAVSWADSLNATNWSHYSSPEVLIPTFVLTVAALSGIKLYTVYLRRIPQAGYITPDALGKRSIFGYVTSVGDGDNFRLYHTPGGRLLGWGWLPGRRVASFKRSELKEQTIQLRIAGIDAPELAHFGKPEQAYGKEALAGLRSIVLGRFVRAKLYRQDQYSRIVGTVSVKRWGLFSSDVGLRMIREGYATVYEAKFGSEFGGMEDKYRAAQKKAKASGRGMWAGQGRLDVIARLKETIFGKQDKFETPREFKDRTKELDNSGPGSKKH